MFSFLIEFDLALAKMLSDVMCEKLSLPLETNQKMILSAPRQPRAGFSSRLSVREGEGERGEAESAERRGSVRFSTLSLPSFSGLSKCCCDRKLTSNNLCSLRSFYSSFLLLNVTHLASVEELYQV